MSVQGFTPPSWSGQGESVTGFLWLGWPRSCTGSSRGGRPAASIAASFSASPVRIEPAISGWWTANRCPWNQMLSRLSKCWGTSTGQASVVGPLPVRRDGQHVACELHRVVLARPPLVLEAKDVVASQVGGLWCWLIASSSRK